jgi:2'-5' RNA ligase
MPVVREKLLKFKGDVIERFGQEGNENFISDDLFQNDAKVHLTFGVMDLKDEEEEKKASELLAKCKENIVTPILSGQPLKIDIKGIDTFLLRNGKSRVLFAKIDKNADKVQAIADQIVTVFAENGIMDSLDARDPPQVKLHVTLMNTTFRERQFRRQPKYWTLERPKRHFDAAPILEQFKDLVVAEDLEVKGLHISTFSKFGDDGFYLPLVQVDF